MDLAFGMLPERLVEGVSADFHEVDRVKVRG
jgi:hypothetical protein